MASHNFTNISVFKNVSNDSDLFNATLTENPLRKLVLLLSFTVCLALVITVGIVGNTIVIFALIRTRAHRQTTTNAYVLNLSIADLLFLLFCVPFQGYLYILNDWPFGDFMCKIVHYCQYCTMYASIWILTVMSVDRYVAIGHPLKSVKRRSPGQAIKICCSVWLSAALASVEWPILYTTHVVATEDLLNQTVCYDVWNNAYEYRKWLILIVFITGFFLPSSVIFCMALLVARAIRTSVEQPLLHATAAHTPFGSKNSSGDRGSRSGCATISKRRRRVVWLVFALSLIFFLCWLPHNLAGLWMNFYHSTYDWVEKNSYIWFIFLMLTRILTYINSSINPILYSLASGQFRTRLAHALFFNNSFQRNTVSHRARPIAQGQIVGGQIVLAAAGGASAPQETFARPKTGSFQPLLYTNNNSRTEDDFGDSRRSSQNANQYLSAQPPDSPVRRRHYDDQCTARTLKPPQSQMRMHEFHTYTNVKRNSFGSTDT